MSKTDKVQKRLDQLSVLIKDVAAKNAAIGELEETFKWGQLSYLPRKKRVGTTVRIDQHDDDHVAMYVHCQTTLVDTYRSLFPELTYDGNRAVLVPLTGRLPKGELKVCIEAALTYHLNK